MEEVRLIECLLTQACAREGKVISSVSWPEGAGEAVLNPAVQRVRLDMRAGAGKSFLPQHSSLLIKLLCGGARRRMPSGCTITTSSLTVPSQPFRVSSSHETGMVILPYSPAMLPVKHCNNRSYRSTTKTLLPFLFTAHSPDRDR